MPINLNTANQKVIVRPDQQPVVLTGATIYDFHASGATQITEVQTGNHIDITIYSPLGTSVEWVDVLNKPNLVLQQDFNTYTGTTAPLQFADRSQFTAHTNNSNIHYTQASIQIQESQVVGLTGDLGNKLDKTTFSTYTGSTAPNQFLNINALDGYWTSGQTVDYVTGYTPSLQWGNITGTLSGQTDLQNALDAKVDFITYNFNNNILSQELENIKDSYLPLTGGTLTGHVDGTSLQLSGDLTVNGTMHTVHAEHIYSNADFIYTRSGNTQGLGVGEISGIGVLNADGSGTTVVLGADMNGIMRVGWSGDTLVALAGREDNPTNGWYAKWNTGLHRFDTQDLDTTIGNKLNTTTFATYTGTTAPLTFANINHGHTTLTGLTITESQVTNLVTDLSGLQTQIDDLSAIQSIGIYYVEHKASDIVGYESLVLSPLTTTGSTEIININNNTVIFDSYATPVEGLGVTGITSGLWIMHGHFIFNSTTGSNFIHWDVYRRTAGGTETFLFRMSTPDINVTTLQEYQIESIQPAFTGWNPSDRIVLKIYAQTTGGAKTATMSYASTTTYGFMQSPLKVNQNPLWSSVTGKPQWLSGTTLSNFEAGHNHSQYLPTTTFATYTGTTAVLQFANKANAVTGATNLGTGNTIYTNVSANKVNLKSLKNLGTGIKISNDANYIYISGGSTGGGTWGSITGTLSGQTDLWNTLQQKTDYQVYYDDLQTIGDNIDTLNTAILLTITGSTSLGTGTSIVGAKSGRNVTNKSLKVLGALGISGTTNDVTIYTTSSGTWGSITGTLSGQTDLWNTLQQKTDYQVYYDDLQTIGDKFDNETIITLTGSTILTSYYAGKVVEINSTGNTTITLPSGMTTGMKVSIVNINTGDVTIAAQGTLQSDGTVLATRYTQASAYHRGSNIWLLYGAKLT